MIMGALFQSSFELTGYITHQLIQVIILISTFQSSFELTGYITTASTTIILKKIKLFQSSFELTGYITGLVKGAIAVGATVSKLFRAYGLYNVFFSFLLKV